MLANFSGRQVQVGALSKELQLDATSLKELIGFIADELPRWRDDPSLRDRYEPAETTLTSRLCGHLNTVARLTPGWDTFQFRIEEPDEVRKGRKIDLVAAPCGPVVWIEGRRCTQFDTLLPIECKRLPTPDDKRRDEWEYVINRSGSTGGIQRFKAGDHAAMHTVAAMIGYVQAESPAIWFGRITSWIKSLGLTHAGWTNSDLLRIDPTDARPDVTIYRSTHVRANGLPEIALHHLWIELPRRA